MRDALIQLLASKKFIVGISSSLTALIVRVAGKHGIGVDPATAAEIANSIVVLASAYLVGQGLTDHGKTAAEVNAEATSKAKPQ